MQRLKRVFHIDIERCRACGGTLRLIAYIETPEVIERILTHLATRETGCINDPRAALGRRSWLFAGSDRGGVRAAAMYTLIVTAKLNDVDPQAWLADVLARIAELPHTRVHELLPWNWKSVRHQTLAA